MRTSPPLTSPLTIAALLVVGLTITGQALARGTSATVSTSSVYEAIGESKSEAPSELDASASSAILGKWKHPDEDAVVEVTESGGVFTGKLVSAPDERAPLGTAVFHGLRFDEAKGIYRGKGYSLRKKKEVDATFEVKGSRLTMKVSVGIMSKTLVWKRA